jgi:NADH-quinone oxidoreductase subunit C
MATEQTAAPALTDEILDRLRAWDSAVVANAEVFRGELTVTVARENLRRVCDFLRTDGGLLFDFLSDVTAVDHFPIEPRFEINYHLLSIPRRRRLRLKSRVSGESPVIESVTSVWPTANWHEREVFDLFGVRFEGHPDLTRILLPEDWEGHPLRKDYPIGGEPVRFSEEK